MKRYFADCRTCEDVKETYKRLAKELHPDCNPGKNTTAAFQEMARQFEDAYNRLKDIHTDASGRTYHKENKQTASEYTDIINNLLKIKGLKIELCGSWIWVTGDTFRNRTELKEMRFCYSSSKKAWYYHDGQIANRRRGSKTMQEIRNLYGSEVYMSETAESIGISAC